MQAPPLTSTLCKRPRGLRLTQTRPGPSASRHTKALQRGSSWPGCGVGCGPSVLVLFPSDRRDLRPQSCTVAARFTATVPLCCAGGGHSCALTYLSLPRAKPETARGRVEGLLAQRGCDHPRGPGPGESCDRRGLYPAAAHADPWSPGMPGVSHVGWAALLAFGSPVLGNIGRKGSG